MTNHATSLSHSNGGIIIGMTKSIITDEMVEKACEAMQTGMAALVRRGLESVLPDIIEACAQAAENTPSNIGGLTDDTYPDRLDVAEHIRSLKSKP